MSVRKKMFRLGSGSYGGVYSDGITVFKRFRRHEHPTTLLNELAVLQFSNSPYLVRGKYAFPRPDGLMVFAMEDGGDPLSSWLEQGWVTADNVLQLLRHMCRGLADLHTCQILHCDIKPANLLVSRDGVLRLADFGLARSVHNDSDRNIVTRWWRCPELELEDGPFGPGIDVWSAGCVFGTLLMAAFDGQKNRPLFGSRHSTFSPPLPEDQEHFSSYEFSQLSVIFVVLQALYEQQEGWHPEVLRQDHARLKLPPVAWEYSCHGHVIPQHAPAALLELLLEMLRPCPDQRIDIQSILDCLDEQDQGGEERSPSPPPSPELDQCMDLPRLEAWQKLQSMLHCVVTTSPDAVPTASEREPPEEQRPAKRARSSA